MHFSEARGHLGSSELSNRKFLFSFILSWLASLVTNFSALLQIRSTQHLISKSVPAAYLFYPLRLTASLRIRLLLPLYLFLLPSSFLNGALYDVVRLCCEGVWQRRCCLGVFFSHYECPHYGFISLRMTCNRVLVFINVLGSVNSYSDVGYCTHKYALIMHIELT